MPHCFNCNYDLTGLDLPHRCPECGEWADPVAERKAAVAWYLGRGALLMRRPPKAANLYLDAPECRALARRRWLRLVLLPWLGCMVALLTMNSIELVHVTERWWQIRERPGEKIEFHRDEHRWRPLTFSLDLDFESSRSWGTPPTSSTGLHGRSFQTLRLGRPRPDGFTILVFLTPPTLGFLGVWFLGGALLADAAATRRSELTRGYWCLAVLIGPWYAVAVTVGIVAAAGFAIGVAWDLPRINYPLFEVAYSTAIGLYVVGGVYVIARTALLTPRAARGPLYWLAIAIATICWIGSLLALWFLASNA